MKRHARRIGYFLIALLIGLAAAAPVLAPNDPRRQHPNLAYAPPMPPRIVDADGSLRRPFVYPLVIVDRLERTFGFDTSAPVPIRFFAAGRLASVDQGTGWLPLGADPLGRDVFSRLAYGARLSLAVAATATFLAIVVGALAGALAGYAGGAIDRVVMGIADVVVILPAAYVVVTLRAAMPLVMAPEAVFWTIVAVLAAASWPLPARGVRAIISAERTQGYAEAAYAAGAGPLRILLRHLLPAARGHLSTQAFLLFPAFILAEATLSYLGLGFASQQASWGVMLQDAASVSVISDAPWILAPAAAIVVSVLATHFVTAGHRESEPSVRL
jgi:peptide/nickel transport system permease protein